MNKHEAFLRGYTRICGAISTARLTAAADEIKRLEGEVEGGLAMTTDLCGEIKRLDAIIEKMPKTADGVPVVPMIDPKDGTAERLGIAFRYTVD